MNIGRVRREMKKQLYIDKILTRIIEKVQESRVFGPFILIDRVIAIIRKEMKGEK